MDHFPPRHTVEVDVQYDVLMAQIGTGATKPKWRSIALPVEHGGWGFTIEPALLGLLVAPSPAAWELAVASLAVFLSRRPVKLVLTDIVRRRWLERTTVAAIFGAIYGAIALAGAVGAVVTADASFWPPLVMALPFATVALYADAHSQSRTLVAELSGAVAMGATVSMIALADGWEMASALGLWLVLAGRAVATIVLVRAQIRRVHGRPSQSAAVYAVQAATVVTLAVAATADVIPWASVSALAAIGVLAYWSLTRPPVAAKVVGWTQIVVGLFVVLSTAVGVWIDW